MGAHKIPKEPKYVPPKTLRQGWEEYKSASIPPSAPEIQLTEMRRAFYFGAAIFFQIEMAHLEDKEEDYEPTPDDMMLMTNLHAEIEDFMLAIKSGEA